MSNPFPYLRLRRCTDAGHELAVLFVSWADVAEPSSDLSHDFVDLERLQNGRFLFQLRTPFNQDPIVAPSLLLVTAFTNNLLDRHFPILKTHRLFLFDFGVAR